MPDGVTLVVSDALAVSLAVAVGDPVRVAVHVDDGVKDGDTVHDGVVDGVSVAENVADTVTDAVTDSVTDRVWECVVDVDVEVDGDCDGDGDGPPPMATHATALNTNAMRSTRAGPRMLDDWRHSRSGDDVDGHSAAERIEWWVVCHSSVRAGKIQHLKGRAQVVPAPCAFGAA